MKCCRSVRSLDIKGVLQDSRSEIMYLSPHLILIFRGCAQDRALRSMALRCTAQLMMTYLQRTVSSGPQLPPVLAPHLANVLHQLRRNAFQYVEQKVRPRQPKCSVARGRHQRVPLSVVLYIVRYFISLCGIMNEFALY